MNHDALARLATNAADDAGPGVVIGIYRGGELTDHAASGMASVELRSPVDVRTRFDIASMSKQFTATAALLLARDGRISLDDDIRTHLPELRLANAVTIAQCLQHTGGLREWLQLTAITGRSLTRITQAQTLEFVAGLIDLDTEPGTAFSYSNTGYVLIASLVHRLTGHTLGEFTADRLFAPLGMRRTLFREDSRAVLPDLAYGYSASEGALLRADSEECAVGDGGLVTSVSDLAPWFRFLRDGDVIGRDIRDALIHTRPTRRDGTLAPYALGISHAAIGGIPMIGHAGAVAGYRSQLLYLPDLDLGVAVFTNSSGVDAGAVAAATARLAADIPEEITPGAVDGRHLAPGLADWWILPGDDEWIRTEALPDGALRMTGLQSGRFTLAADGRWYSDDRETGLRLLFDADRVEVGMAFRPGRELSFRRCTGPEDGLPIPAGVYLSSELGTLATIRQDGGFRLGLELTGVLQPGPDGTFRAGPAALRADGDDLQVSLLGARRVRFLRQPDETTAVGLPRGLDTP
jgi:CubicO group peptidase (beta-lactamase class C family)